MSQSADQNLLFGVLALQLDFISREQLVAAVTAWTLEKSRPLQDILVDQGHLPLDCRELLSALVAKHLSQHGGDAVKSLRSLSSLGETKTELLSVADSEVQASLGHVALERDPYATIGPLSQPTEGLRFRILRPHARGGLGEVFVAEDEELHRQVALKEIQALHADSLENRLRFIAEAEITGKLEHPGIVPVYGLGQYDDGRPYYAMRFIRGDSLKEAIERFHQTKNKQQLSSSAVHVERRKLLQRLIDVCQALDYAHSRGVLHRDLKPGNIMLGRYGETLVVDWGLAKATGVIEPTPLDREQSKDSQASTAPVVPQSGSSVEPTRVGMAVGTPEFMSPEQAEGRLDDLGPATDVYSLGAILFTILTGKPPIQRQEAEGELLQRIAKTPRPSARSVAAATPKPLDSICLRALALNPGDRYASAGRLAEDLEHYLADESVTAHSDSFIDRAMRFTRRHKSASVSAVAALVLVSTVALLAVVAISGARRSEAVANAQLQEANGDLKQAKIRADAAAEQANEQATIAKLEAEKAKAQEHLANLRLYAAQLVGAQQAWRESKVMLAIDQLENTRTDLRGWEYSYLSKSFRPYLQNLQDSGSVYSVAYSPDGKQIVSSSEDNTIKVWNVAAGESTLVLQGHSGHVSSVAFSPNGKQIASGSWDNTIKVWDVATGKITLTLQGHTGHVTSVAFSPNGKQIASGSWDNTIKVWDVATGEIALTLEGHTDIVRSVAFGPDGKQVASGSKDKTIKLWDLASDDSPHTLRGHTDNVFSVAFSPSGEQIASGSEDRTVRVWDAATGKCAQKLQEHTGIVFSVAFSPTGEQIASGSLDKTIKVWDVATGKNTLTLQGHTEIVFSVAFGPTGEQIASGSWDDTIKVWGVAASENPLTLAGHTNSVSGVAFSPNGRQVASGSLDSTVKLWDADTGENTQTLRGHTDTVFSVVYSPDGQQIASGSLDKTIRIWDVATGQRILTLRGHTDDVNSVFSPDGKHIVSGSWDDTIKVWDIASGESVFTLQGHSGHVSRVAFRPDGNQIASGSFDRTIKVWDVATRESTLTLRGHTEIVRSVAFSPDGKQIVSGSWDDTIKVWDVATGKNTLTLQGHTGHVNSVAFSPDGKQIVSGSWDDTIKVWDVATGESTFTLQGHTDSVNSVTFSPDGRQIASGSLDHTIKIWSADVNDSPD